MKHLRTFAILALITFAMFFVCELSARILQWRALDRPPAATVYSFSTGGVGDLEPSFENTITVLANRPYQLRTNSAGLRNSAEVNDDPAVIRVLAIGDSYTFGAYVHNQEDYPARLEQYLNQRYAATGPRFQVLNAGVPGYTIADQLAYMRDKGLRLDPDLVIVGFYTNDIIDYLPQKRDIYARAVVMASANTAELPQLTPTAAWLYRHSALFGWITGLRQSFGDFQVQQAIAQTDPLIIGIHETYQNMTFLRADAPEYAEYWDAYAADFRALAQLCRENDLPLVLLAFPDLVQMPTDIGFPEAPQTFLADLAQSEGVPFFDALPTLRAAGAIPDVYLVYYNPDAPVDAARQDAKTLVYSGDGHLNPHGYQVVAQALGAWLVAQGLLPAPAD
jgi:lysophospholipase L1-like esterase